MRILHIASFKGNVGDIVNHNGFYKACNIDLNDVTHLEMRRFYKNANDLYFDYGLASYINEFDRLIIGGGAYFDIRYQSSCTGTTLDMSDDFIDSIDIPVLVNAIGIDVDYDNKCAIDKFKTFFDKICNNSKWDITLRNDGSKDRLNKILGRKNDLNKIKVVPDNGYVFNNNTYKRRDGIVGLSISNDLFSKDFNGDLSAAEFNQIISRVCNRLIDMDKDIIFFLHAPQDIETFYQIYSSLDKRHFRSRIALAPFDVSSTEGAKRLDAYYKKCEFVIAMRFHGNVLAIKNSIPVIGLAGHEQITGMYSELGLADRCVVVNPHIEDALLNKIHDINSPEGIGRVEDEKQVMRTIIREHGEYSHYVNEWLYA